MAIPELNKGPVSTGFLRGGSETPIPLDDWRYKVDFVGGPCEAPSSYPNIQAVCETEDDPGNPVINIGGLGSYDPKKLSDTHIAGGFRPWPIYDIQVCAGDDIVRPVDRERVLGQLDNHRSRLFAEEFSGGVYSGSPSLRSVGVPVSDTAFSIEQAIYELLEAVKDKGVSGPHLVHVPLSFRPFFDRNNIVSNEEYRIIYDFFEKDYVPVSDVVSGGTASAPTVGQGWIAVTGNYEYGFTPIDLDDGYTIEGKTGNLKAVMGEQKLFYRFDTCGVFLAKVAVFGS